MKTATKRPYNKIVQKDFLLNPKYLHLAQNTTQGYGYYTPGKRRWYPTDIKVVMKSHSHKNHFDIINSQSGGIRRISYHALRKYYCEIASRVDVF